MNTPFTFASIVQLMFIITLVLPFEIVFCVISSNKRLSLGGKFYFWQWLKFNCELRFEKKGKDAT